MARYRVKTRSFINGSIVEAGAEVEYTGRAGSNLEPLDRPAVVSAAEAGPVEIPADWRGLSDWKRINIARRLGAPAKGTGAVEADAAIDAELARRAAAKE